MKPRVAATDPDLGLVEPSALIGRSSHPNLWILENTARCRLRPFARSASHDGLAPGFQENHRSVIPPMRLGCRVERGAVLTVFLGPRNAEWGVPAIRLWRIRTA